nr:thiamine pyrophosphate-dependent enzyme [Azospirillum baldaniorum]
MSRPSSPLNAAGAAYLEALQERFREDPASVDVSWRAVFQILDELGAVPAGAPVGGPAGDPTVPLRQEAIRQRGHAAAALDPLGRAAPPASSESEDAQTARLRRLYQGTLTLETAHIDDPALRSWLRDAYEGAETVPPAEARRRALALLTAAEEFERLLGVRYPTKKRFGAEGMETLIPLLDRILAAAAAAGVTEVQVGTMHRGRLSLMANALGKPLVELFAGIKGMHPFLADPPVPADVPYHMGVESNLSFGERSLALTLSPNPSHLEAINPVTLGRARARQDLERDQGGEAKRVLCVLLHTDASVIGQGSVTEALQLSGVPGFTVAGTIHVIVNNQIGFTTEREEARTSLHCTGLWKAVDSPILHVNADDPDAALRAADLAVAFRQAHGRDAVIDLVGYRRNGHNEIDEPRFTQPLDYKAIDAHPPARALYAQRLAADGLVGPEEAEALAAGHKARFQEALAAASDHRPNHDGFPGGRWAPFAPAGVSPAEPDTGIADDRLRGLLAALAVIPDGLAVDRKVERRHPPPRRGAAGLGDRRGAGLRHAARRRDAGAADRPGRGARRLLAPPFRADRHRHRAPPRQPESPGCGAGAVRRGQQPAVGIRRPRLRVRLQPGAARRAGDLGGAVRRFRQRRADHDRPVHRQRRGQMAPALRPRYPAAARAGGAGAGTLLRPAGALPPDGGARQHPRRPPLHPGQLLPSAAPADAAPRPQAPGGAEPEDAAAPARRRVDAGRLRAGHRLPPGDRHRRGAGRAHPAVQRQAGL